MATIQERLISGKGLLRVPVNADTKKAKILTLFCDVVRKPTQDYLNEKSNPPKSFYARLTFMRLGAVMECRDVEFASQIFEFSPEGYYQGIYALMCAEAALRQTIVQLGVTGISSAVDGWRHDYLWFDEVRAVCYSDAAISLRLVSTPYDICVSLDDTPPKDPPIPPAPPTPVPPKTPLDGSNGNPIISPPYDDEEDNGDSVPYPTDSSVPPPPPGCVQKAVTVHWVQQGGNQNGQSFSGGDSGNTPYRTRVVNGQFLYLDFSVCADGVVTSQYGDPRLITSFSSAPIDGYDSWYRDITTSES